MPEELGNLLIRITSVGFDEVLAQLNQLEEAASRVSSGAFSEFQYALDGIKDDLDEISEGLKEATNGYTSFGAGANNASQHVDESTKALQRNQSVLTSLAKAYASFWVMFNAPKKFFNTLDGVAQFNRNLTTLSVNAKMSEGSLLALGTAAGAFGGSAEGIGAFGAKATQSMQNLRMGRGGGAFTEASILYGLSLSGTAPGHLANSEEMMRNTVVALQRLKTDEQRLGLKNLLGLDDGTYQLMLKGVETWDKTVAKARDYQKRLDESKKKTEEWNRATAELDTEWQILKNEVFSQLAPLVTRIVELVKDITKALQDHPGLLAAVLSAATAIGIVVGAWKFGQAVVETAKLVGNLRNIKDLWNGVKSEKDVAGGGSGSSAATAAGVGKVGGWFGLGLGIANTGANAVTTGKQWQSATTLGYILETLRGWYALWATVTVSHEGVKLQGLEKQYRSAFKHLKTESEEDTDLWVRQFMLADKRRREMEKRVWNGLGKNGKHASRTAESGTTVSIEKIDITVNSEKADANDVARSVREELFRQINDSIADAVSRSKVL